MRMLAEAGPLKGAMPSVDEAFILGLFHDVGKLIFGEFLEDEQAAVEQLVKQRRIPWHVAEREIIGVDHAELGSRLAEQWKLPQVFVHAIAAHHDLACAPAEFKNIAAGLAIANYLCNASGLSWQRNHILSSPQGAWEALGVSSSGAVGLCNQFFERLPQVQEYLSFTE
jgi:putative nucleotidyltransferase with HDIG domain